MRYLDESLLLFVLMIIVPYVRSSCSHWQVNILKERGGWEMYVKIV